MAKSPAGLPSGASTLNISAAKAKGNVVATSKSRETATHSKTSSNGAGLELAEELNEETRRKYVKGKRLGEGTYADVYLAHLATDPSSLFAIKKIKVQENYKDGLLPGIIAEVMYLRELSHPNIIALHSVFSTKDQNLNLVLEYLPLGDLEMLIKDTTGVNYGPADVKAWMGMLGRAVWFCHENFVLHRDIKPNNLLIAADGEVKLADFGLARSFADPYAPMTHNVITRWYRPPELFYRARYYSGAVDVWSMGTVFAELILRTPFLKGLTDINQLELISKWIGTPTEENWPGVSKLEGYVPPVKEEIVPVHGLQSFMRTFGSAGTAGVELLMWMLRLDPRKRATARQVLQHEWWRMDPKPSRKEDLPKKAGGEKKMADDLKRKGGEVERSRGDKIARKLDFSKG